MERKKKLGWRVGSAVWTATFLLATVAMLLGMKLLFSVEDAYATARLTPPLYILPTVPVCMFCAGGCTVLSVLVGIPAAPPPGYSRVVTILRVIAVTVFIVVFMLLLFYLQRHSGSVLQFIWQVLTNRVVPAQ